MSMVSAPAGLCADAFYSWRHRLWHGQLSAGAAERSLPKEAHTDIQRLPKLDAGEPLLDFCLRSTVLIDHAAAAAHPCKYTWHRVCLCAVYCLTN